MGLVEEFEESDHRVGEPGDPVEVMVGMEMVADESGGVSEMNGGCTSYTSVSGEDAEPNPSSWSGH